MNNKINVNGLTKNYSDPAGFTKELFKDLSFELNPGEFTTILAPNGSGKTSLLKIITKLDLPSSGEISNADKSKLFIPSDSIIFPWLDVRENILYNLRDYSEEEFKEIVSFVGLAGYEDHYPNIKSKGFILRVALARSIIRKPDWIVLDDPFAGIKTSVKTSLISLTRACFEQKKINFLLGTTNLNTALLLSDKILLMKPFPGEIINSFLVKFSSIRNQDLVDNDEFKLMKKEIENIIDNSASLQQHQFAI